MTVGEMLGVDLRVEEMGIGSSCKLVQAALAKWLLDSRQGSAIRDLGEQGGEHARVRTLLEAAVQQVFEL